MKISFWSIGKANEAYVKSGIDEFTKRIARFYPIEWNIIPVPKNSGMLSEMDLKKREAETILQLLRPEDYNGKSCCYKNCCYNLSKLLVWTFTSWSKSIKKRQE